LIALNYLFVLHIKGLINLKMFGSVIGIGGTIAPIASPGYAPGIVFPFRG